MFIIVNMQLIPSFSSPMRYPTAPSDSPKDMRAVGLALIPSLCSRETHLRSLRSPGPPSGSTRNFGTMKQEIPLVPGGASGVRANTMWMMFSAMPCSPQVMKVLVPLMR